MNDEHKTDEYCEQAIRRLRRKFGIAEENPGELEGRGAEEIARRRRIDHARYISNPLYKNRVDAAYPEYSRAVSKQEGHNGENSGK